MNRRTLITSVAAFTGSLCGLVPVLAQNSSRLIRVLVPLAPGGAVDPYARLVADQMAKSLGRVVIVEHKPGANGNVGHQFAAREPADGSLILVTTQAMTEINLSAFRDATWSLDDFIPLIRGVEAPLVLVAHPSVPAKTLDELVAWVRRNPGKLSYSSYNVGTPSHFLGFQFNQRFGLDLVHVPAKGSGFQATDLMAGHVLFGFAQVQSTMQLIQEGKLNAIAVTSAARSRFLPNVPSFAELGHSEFTSTVWFGLMVRAGTPPAAVESLLNAAKTAHANPDVRAKLEAQGFDMSGETGPGFAADIKAQMERWSRLVQASGFKGEGG
ncbi:MAG TPA: tripartite tricarboxylate transporter substrate binding protein [Xanthobacteraceae bacterium]|nr:tripartite tricarboxylate transporter substrate binding protein [Xanthobacteraceae bacterium]